MHMRQGMSEGSFSWSRAARRVRVAAAAAVLLSALPAAATQAAEPLVSVGWLKQRLGDPGLVVLDIRSGAEPYAQGHIPGAIHSDYERAGWRVTRQGVPLVLPTPAELEKLIGEHGIDEDKHVVVVPPGQNATDFGAAARVYWTLKVAGVPKVSVLDGGYAAWTADAANPIETKPNRPNPTIFTVRLDRRLLAELGEVESAVGNGAATLVDARPATFFLGKVKAALAAAYGRIPGAINVEHSSFYDPAANRLRPKAELAALAARIPDGPVISYCNTGHWAATNWFVLSEILGREVKLYDGSMVEWAADSRRRVESDRTRWDDLKRLLGMGS